MRRLVLLSRPTRRQPSPRRNTPRHYQSGATVGGIVLPTTRPTEGNIMNLFSLLEGKRTYIVAFLAAALGLAQAIWPDFVVPEWAAYILGAVGVTTMRAAITNSK